jgi:hypothetical protein
MVTSRAHMSLSNACKLWSGIGSDLNASRSYRASTIRLVLILEQQRHFVLARNERSVWFTSGWRQKVDAQQRTRYAKENDEMNAQREFVRRVAARYLLAVTPQKPQGTSDAVSGRSSTRIG